jgi:carboxyl-terminal processing protease
MYPRPRTFLTLIAGAVLGFGGAMATGVLAERSAGATRPASEPVLPWEEANLFAEVYERIKREYVRDIDDHTLMEKALRGMVAGLDPHSAYLDSEEFEEIRLSTMGSYPGVGIEVAPADGTVKILRTFEDSPAQRAGLRPDDEIVRIDGAEVGADVTGAIARLRGPSGSTVRLTVRRTGAPHLMEFPLERADVEVSSVTAQTLEPGIGYVRITTFSETTPADLSRAILSLKRDNHSRLGGLILDLRDNPGGVLESGVAVADDFLERGVIVTADGRTPEARFEMDATPGDLIEGAPLVVLVNGGTASASEIVAAALKDHARAVLVGSRTYGKGSVQTVMPLTHGGAIKLTTSLYFTPSGASIQGKGIVPDILEPESAVGPPEPASSDGAPRPLLRDREVQAGLEALRHRAAGRDLAAARVPVSAALVP